MTKQNDISIRFFILFAIIATLSISSFTIDESYAADEKSEEVNINSETKDDRTDESEINSEIKDDRTDESEINSEIKDDRSEEVDINGKIETDPGTTGGTSTSSGSGSSSGSHGGGGGSGGGSGRTGVGPSSGGSTVIPSVGEIIIYSASWDCSTGMLQVIAGPDSDALSLQIRTAVNGVQQLEQSEEKLKNRTIFTGIIDKDESYVSLKLIASSGRNVGVVQESINITQCAGEKTFNEYVEKQIPPPQIKPNENPDTKTQNNILDQTSHIITGGSINSIEANPENKSLVISIDAIDDGTLSITLPREIIDSKLSSGEDGSFLVLIDGKSASFTEDSYDNERVLSIDFANGSKTIEIIGTMVVPEFGTIAMMILVISIIAVIAISSKSRIMPRI